MSAEVTYALTLQRLQERAARTAAGFLERLGELPIAMPQMCAALHLLDTGETQFCLRGMARSLQRVRLAACTAAGFQKHVEGGQGLLFAMPQMYTALHLLTAGEIQLNLPKAWPDLCSALTWQLALHLLDAYRL